MSKQEHEGPLDKQDIPKGMRDFLIEITDIREQLQELRGEALFQALPETCRTECTIAKIVIKQLMQDGIKGLWVREKLGECPATPQVIGSCSTQKTVCSHPESGNTDNMAAQVHMLYEYVQD